MITVEEATATIRSRMLWRVKLKTSKEGQTHEVSPEALAPVMMEFFKA
jgi:hypothetical protein